MSIKFQGNKQFKLYLFRKDMGLVLNATAWQVENKSK